MIVCWTAGTVNRIYTIEEEHELWMVAVYVFFAGLQGFLNAFVYGANENVRAKIRKMMRNVRRRCFKRDLKSDDVLEEPNIAEKLVMHHDISTLSDQEKNIFDQVPDIQVKSNYDDSNGVERNLSQEETTNIIPKVYSKSDVSNISEDNSKNQIGNSGALHFHKKSS